MQELLSEIEMEKEIALALDFDGVCKKFTEHKHQIMFTTLFLHLREFQRVPFEAFRDAYLYIFFRHPETAGRERFLCARALACYLAEKGYDCALTGIDEAVGRLQADGRKISEENLLDISQANEVRRLIAWSHEINEKVEGLTEIGLTPGIDRHIFAPFRERADFYVVSTATEAALRASLEQEGIDYIKRYYGQETATKSEALTALCHAGYRMVMMFGDSLEDARAARNAYEAAETGVEMFFCPIIPDDEAVCFERGQAMLDAIMENRTDEAREIEAKQKAAFAGREAGSAAKENSPISITQ